MKKYNYVADLKKFNTAFKPTVSYAKLIREEFNEWFTEAEERPNTEFELKELCDLLYVVCGYAQVEGWDIERNFKEVGTIISKVLEYSTKYPQINLPVTVIVTAYAEFITSKDSIWLYRLAQGIFAYAEIRNFEIEKAFKRVHKSNMSKLENGKPIYREDGKVLKGSKYKPAQLGDLFNDKKASSTGDEASGKVETLKGGDKASIG